MPEPENGSKLEMRIARLEKLIEGLAPESRAPQALTADEVAAYRKVQDVIAAGEFSGINECSRCFVVRCMQRCITICGMVCRACDVECICGPCGFGGLGSRLSRFGGLGE